MFELPKTIMYINYIHLDLCQINLRNKFMSDKMFLSAIMAKIKPGEHECSLRLATLLKKRLRHMPGIIHV